ncbi:phosphoesterase [Photobacterium angustum]|uniref:metallophosphoesterase n=2 Tax=Photobacterium angustum TaxID=661 RepID=UPI000D16AC3B|nr:metallophosphoesterase [Photobacterium angustum]PSW96071.1 phosphoesterase [Photobacterium angustum]PSX00861.1 phosphoesterase [Photobacterium angustum]PSX38231.1 phosphoesterase [Photobacterium angustum]
MSYQLSRRQFLLSSASVAATSATVLPGCKLQSNNNQTDQTHRIALLGDVHFHDIHGDFGFNDNEVCIRTMQDSVGSTRMFNENYFVFKATLDDIVAEGIKFVILVGDFSDDGQEAHVDGLKRVLDQYSDDYGLEFFLTHGNHDPTTPYGEDCDKTFLRSDGAGVKVTSNQDDVESFIPTDEVDDVLYSPKMQSLGFTPLMEKLGRFGFQSQPHYHYYETPWKSNKLEDRVYQAISADGAYTVECPDSSYLVEPIEGFWICSVDMNTHVPLDPLGSQWDHDAKGYEDGKVQKPQVLAWLKDVIKRADEQGKTLLVFSHYPAIEYLNYSADDFYYLFADSSYNHKRVPTSETTEELIDCGLKLHFAGHIHINDTAKYVGRNGQTLVNVQAPSLAAYIPAYKKITCYGPDDFEIETKVIEDVPEFDSLFNHYENEIDWRTAKGLDTHWKSMLEVSSYRELMYQHLICLTVNNKSDDWGWDMRHLYQSKFPLYWLMVLSLIDDDLSGTELSTLVDNITPDTDDTKVIDLLVEAGIEQVSVNNAIEDVNQHLINMNYSRQQLNQAIFTDYCNAMLHIRNGDELALQDIGLDKVVGYSVVAELFGRCDIDNNLENHDYSQDYIEADPEAGSHEEFDNNKDNLSNLKLRLAALARIFHMFRITEPTTHFRVFPSRGEVLDLFNENPLRIKA